MRPQTPAVLIATYEQPRWLRLALAGWSRQTVAPAQVIVADDGSGPETAEVVREAAAHHVFLPRGAQAFGKCRSVNQGLRRAAELGVDFVLLTDGDCLPARDLLERHLRSARPGRFTAGGVVRLSREASEALCVEDVRAGRFERGHGGDKPLYHLPRPLGLALDALSPRRTPLKGGNSAVWLRDLFAVNGYDERFVYGLEDKELGERLAHAGVQPHSLRYSAPVFHLWHERPYADPAGVTRNRALLEASRRERAVWTPHGLHPLRAEGSAAPWPSPHPSSPG